jgi:hypothetical protein
MKYGIKILPIICLAMFVLLQQGLCQPNITFDKLVDFLPPAPNASAITRYGDATVNKNSGTPNISIPLFTVKGIKLSTGISLGYSSNGIKVDEIASRVGMGWAINAGGVITRTLRGQADELNARHYPYTTIGFNWGTHNYMKRIAESQNAYGNSGGFDAEPDLFNFSFDGYSGSFAFDGNGFIQVNKSGIKIEKDFTSNPSIWNFKLTTPDGNNYLFGGTSAVEKTKRTNSCGKNYNTYLPTAWYLKEIQHLNGEKIIFNYTAHTYSYDNGVSQTMYDPGLGGLGSGCTCSAISTTTCVNITSTVGVLLSSIEITGKAAINFEYIARDDCNDQLISKIIYKDPVNTISSIDFTYSTITSSAAYNNQYNQYEGPNKTPYLVSVSENSADNALHKKHYFSYINPADRPSRLSFSQDHWGYFNGKVNSSFTPDLGINYHAGFPNATANREPDFAYSKKGLLQKIVYPTGGTTTLFYGPNIVDNGATNDYTTLHKLSCDVTGTGAYAQVEKSKVFHTEINQQVKIQLEVRNNFAPQEHDPAHHFGSVKILDLTNNTVVFTQTSYVVGFNQIITAFLPTQNHQYKLVLTANGAQVTTLATMHYYPKINLSANTGQIAGGMRIEKIATANPGENAMVKKFYYGTLADLNKSSLSYVAKPVYVGIMDKVVSTCENPGSFTCNYTSLSSSSIFNLGYFNNGLVSYHSVVESIGENFEGGGVETKYYSGPDGLGQVMWNRDIINSPFTNFSSFYNAKPQRETVVKKLPNNTLVPIKKTEYIYRNDPAGENEVYGYAVVQRVTQGQIFADTLCDVTLNCNQPLSCCFVLNVGLGVYDMVRYSVFSSFVTPESVTETIYDENGQNPVVTVNNSFYENLQNFQLTRSESTNSKGQLIRTSNKYPHDYTGTQVYDEMINKNIIASLVNSKSEIVNAPGPNTVLSEQQIDYSNAGNLNYVPTAIKKSVQGNTLETEGTIDFYDANGNILQFTGKNGIISSIVWGYNHQYPVAQVVGATYANVIAQLTGGSVSALQTMDGATLRTELNQVRTNLNQASVTTYTYKHLKGVHTITDPNNKTNTYEYDSFNRLMIIKDQDGNAVKKNEYVYANPDPNTGLTIFYNAAQLQSPPCNSCIPGFVASTTNPATYEIPFGKYYSLINQLDADAKADLDMATYGQEFVNKNSTCSNAATCTEPDYKFVSCACEKGIPICEYSTEDPNNPGNWWAHLHLRWSDGSISPSYTNYIEGCTGPDKKFLNCVCETGEKICESTVYNGNGSYTVTYHYQWSDNSTSSPPIVETIACSGPDKKMIGCECKTAEKIYISSVYCGISSDNGCCPHKWKCEFYYKWSDNSTSLPTTYFECSTDSCMPEEEKDGD